MVRTRRPRTLVSASQQQQTTRKCNKLSRSNNNEVDIAFYFNKQPEAQKASQVVTAILSPQTPPSKTKESPAAFLDFRYPISGQQKEKLTFTIESDNDNGLKIPLQVSSPHRIQLPVQDAVQEEEGTVIVTDLQYKNDKQKTVTKKTATDTNRKLTDYFPVRRSVRKTKQTVLEEKQRTLEKLLRDGVEEGLVVCHFDGKGRGVVTTRPFARGDFVVEYSGELLDLVTAKRREARYAQDCSAGCYMYYFKFGNQQYCVDATVESGRLGRLVNHSRNGNLVTKTVLVDCLPRLILVAKENIAVGEEIAYDYGDRSKESLRNHPWLAL